MSSKELHNSQGVFFTIYQDDQIKKDEMARLVARVRGVRGA
jgi:hypothetical protein